MNKFLIGFDLPNEILSFQHPEFEFKASDIGEDSLIEATVLAAPNGKTSSSHLYDFCILASLLLNQLVTIRAEFDTSANGYRLTRRYLDNFNLAKLPSGPGSIFANLNATLEMEFSAFSRFLSANPKKADNFIYFHNTLVLRLDSLLGFSTQVILLERLLNRLIKDKKIEIPLNTDQKKPSLYQKIEKVLEVMELFPNIPNVNDETIISAQECFESIKNTRNQLFHGNEMDADLYLSRVIFEINRRLLMAEYGSTCAIVYNNWQTIGRSFVPA